MFWLTLSLLFTLFFLLCSLPSLVDATRATVQVDRESIIWTHKGKVLVRYVQGKRVFVRYVNDK